jgi:hypothetical protein
MSHNSSRLDSYGLVKLENPHELSRRSKKSNYSRSSQKKLTSQVGETRS